MLKKIIFLVFVNLSCFLYAQQVRNPMQEITRFAVVNLPRVYEAFFQESRQVRQFEERSTRVQNEVNRRTREIQELRSQHAAAVLNNNENEAQRLEGQIHRLQEALRTYYQTQTAILESERRALLQSGTFLDQVYDEIRIIAESEGISIVFDSAANENIIWFSRSIDITDRLISSLLSRRR